MRKILHILFFLLFAGAAAWLAWDAWSNWNCQQKFRTMAQEIEEEQAKPENSTKSRIELLKEINPDVVGYVEIPDTPIAYPVMQNAGEEGAFYLWRNMKGEKDRYGTPFLDIRCDIRKPSQSLWVYGHNMHNKTMFSYLEKYRNQSYREKHPEIIFEREGETGIYEIAAAIDLDISRQEDSAFFDLIDPEPEEMQEYLEWIRERQLYDTGVTLQEEDRLLCLSTCYRFRVGKSGRVAVIARLKEIVE